MKNLYQKLSEENLQKLADFTKQHRTTGSLLTEALISNHSWGFIRLGDALQIWNCFEDAKPFDFDEFTEFFKN